MKRLLLGLLVDSWTKSASLSVALSIEANQRNYPDLKESTTTSAFKRARER